jgi:hypothetical protein
MVSVRGEASTAAEVLLELHLNGFRTSAVATEDQKLSHEACADDATATSWRWVVILFIRGGVRDIPRYSAVTKSLFGLSSVRDEGTSAITKSCVLRPRISVSLRTSLETVHTEPLQADVCSNAEAAHVEPTWTPDIPQCGDITYDSFVLDVCSQQFNALVQLLRTTELLEIFGRCLPNPFTSHTVAFTCIATTLVRRCAQGSLGTVTLSIRI